MEQPGGADDGELAQLIASIALTPIATVVTDHRLPDYPIIAANAAFCSLTGYAQDEVVGRNCRFLGGSGTEEAGRAELRDAVSQGRPVVVELTNYRKDGSPFLNAVMIAPIRDQQGRPLLFVGSQMDVGQRGGSRQAEASRLVAQLTRRQREVLELMTGGYRNKQIGGALGIDEKTVKMHRARMIEALGVRTSADAIRIAVEAGLGN